MTYRRPTPTESSDACPTKVTFIVPWRVTKARSRYGHDRACASVFGVRFRFMGFGGTITPRPRREFEGPCAPKDVCLVTLRGGLLCCHRPSHMAVSATYSSSRRCLAH